MLSGKAVFTSIKLAALALLASWPAVGNAQSWPDQPGSFLSPNRFAVVSEVDRARLWLEAGFGRDIVKIHNVNIGAEALVWSRLRQLSDFRFPVETADYFFGLYSTFDLLNAKHRFRVSHISAHLVDGSDTVRGGSSSKFSKEFVSIERAYSTRLLTFNVFGAFGIRWNFHQVTKMESAFQFPSSFNVRFLEWGNTHPAGDSSIFAGQLFATISADAGPFLPAVSYGLTARLAFTSSAALDLFGRYYTGASRAGVFAESSDDFFEIGVRVIPFSWIE